MGCKSLGTMCNPNTEDNSYTLDPFAARKGKDTSSRKNYLLKREIDIFLDYPPVLEKGVYAQAWIR